MRCLMPRKASGNDERKLKRLQESSATSSTISRSSARMDAARMTSLPSRAALEEAREQMGETARNLQQQQLSQAANSGSVPVET
ncbi:MAG: hypothetical protein CM1200mP34_1320 [Verrucomicrobiales bacterium]|nr:MAG: hypothetical protein CM1200mP34_1320 [Verrucomicrobiales bacterium]